MSDIEKVDWSGRVVSVQPRIRLLRSFDQREHSYLGFVLCIDGQCGNELGQFLVAIGKETQEKHQIQVGMELRGTSVPVEDPRLETAGFYKTSQLVIEKGVDMSPSAGPPFFGPLPDLPTYRARGHRRLSAKTYADKCAACIWGCRMPVEMIVDPWKPSNKKYRFETFCYGPKSCPLYGAGPTRKVPGRQGMSWEEEDWVDEEETSHRGMDD